MKSRVRTYSKKEIGWLCGEAMEEIDRCINSNGIVFLIALMRHTGWKKKRIEDFLLTLNTTMDEYHKHCLDNVFDYMAGKELAEIGIDMDQCKQDISEVKNLQAEMSGFHEYFKAKED